MIIIMITIVVITLTGIIFALHHIIRVSDVLIYAIVCTSETPRNSSLISYYV